MRGKAVPVNRARRRVRFVSSKRSSDQKDTINAADTARSGCEILNNNRRQNEEGANNMDLLPINFTEFFLEHSDPIYTVKDEECLATRTSEARWDTQDDCLTSIKTLMTLILDRPDDATNEALLHHIEHIRFLQTMLGRLPAGFVSLDASRPWMIYWSINALAVLGFDVSEYRTSLVKTLGLIQNETGGFGGSQGQYSHLATTYASVLSLLTVGGEETLNLIDRQAMWKWLGSLKEADGSFHICQEGEIDVRAAYCVVTLLTLLNLPLELPDTATTARQAGHTTFLDGLVEWVGCCQTYEGGIGSCHGAEAHGAYTFCALACLCIIDEPQIILPKALDVAGLARWLAARQDHPLGGLAGRTNKLVDGCYSTWIGGCYPLVEAACRQQGSRGNILWEPDGLIQYIYGCAQEVRPSGGLRDKPGMRPDAYHTNYNLLGLVTAQYDYSVDAAGQAPEKFQTGGQLTAGFRWKATERPRTAGGDDFDRHFRSPADLMTVMNPVFNISESAVEASRQFFDDKRL